MKGDCYKEEEKGFMGKLEKSVEWLRHYVDTNGFDYCVVWKLGDDPSRFIEWMNCCCGGGLSVKEAPEIENHISSLCRDADFRHLKRSKACEALACFPSSIPLYYGIHGDVVISNHPRWICSANSTESTGTQVLIPVLGGLIEFYSEKHIPMDQKIIDFIMVRLNVNSELESMTIQSSTNFNDPVLNVSDNTPHVFPCLSLAKIQFPHHSLEGGSSTVTTPSNEISSLESVFDPMSPPLSSTKQFVGIDYGYHKNSPKQKAVFSSVCEKRIAEIKNGKLIKRPDGEKNRSKNIELERARRNRIRDGLYALRALVPNISKMDKASILGDAVEHIEELQKKVNVLKGELKELNDDNWNTRNVELKRSTRNTRTNDIGHKQVSSGDVVEKKQMEVQMEANQVGERDVLLKLIYVHKQGGFVRLMKAMDSLGLLVVDANVTTYDGMDLNILSVQANNEIQIMQLRDSLIKLTG